MVLDNDFSLWSAYNYHYWPAKYFIDKEELIVRNFQFKRHIKEKASKLISGLGENICSVHVRRGDYLNLQHVHRFPGSEYYQSAIETICELSKNTKFLIFSDDIEWCKSLEIFRNCLFSEESDDRELKCA